MKAKIAGLLLLLVSLALGAPVHAYETYKPETFTTGQDWMERMTDREKFIALVPPALVFYQYNVHPRRSLPEYIPLIDKVMAYNPQLAGQDVANIFASTLYLFEPESRTALKRMETEFLRGNYKVQPPSPFRLSLRDTLEEISI